MTLHAISGGKLLQLNNPFMANNGQSNFDPERKPPANLIGWLNRILAEETRRMMRFRSHYFYTIEHPHGISTVFLIHSNEKLLHVDAIALRIVQLNGTPDFSSESLYGDSHKGVGLNGALMTLIEENLQAERVAINAYRDLLKYLADSDLATSRILKSILKSDERRVEELVNWLGEVAKKPA